jgi:hypothetical protein
MKKLVLASLFLIPVSGYSEILVCHFTEPFITISYDTDTNVLGYQSANDEISFTDIAVVKFEKGGLEISGSDKEVKLFVDFTKEGSDGMSDVVYLYEGRHQGLWGGCNPNTKDIQE